MDNSSPRVDSASLLIKASPVVIYQSFLDPVAVAAWRPPAGMSCEVYAFDPRVGGGYKMAFRYRDRQATAGKTTKTEDVFEGRFVQLIPEIQIVEEVDFISDDPAYSGTMTITTRFIPEKTGTVVRFEASNVPPGISPEDHHAGMMSSLQNLAKYLE
ncbi:MAG: SRPBCC domain-containing protein [Pseudobacter sp.]|uniref:SRPBCC domain-containing protein n=1 Tax=Pseudobacter sp. TaxID=2045420 RepID=UPI003F8175FE